MWVIYIYIYLGYIYIYIILAEAHLTLEPKIPLFFIAEETVERMYCVVGRVG